MRDRRFSTSCFSENPAVHHTVFFEKGYSSDRSKNFLTISTVTLDKRDELALRIYNDRVLEACHHGGRTRHKNRRTTSRRRHRSLGMQFVMDLGDCSRSIPFHPHALICNNATNTYYEAAVGSSICQKRIENLSQS
jgi:hypothetical protein